jgi:hypothetical protein
LYYKKCTCQGRNLILFPAASSSFLAASLNLSRAHEELDNPARVAASAKVSFSSSLTRIWKTSAFNDLFGFLGLPLRFFIINNVLQKNYKIKGEILDCILFCSTINIEGLIERKYNGKHITTGEADFCY